MQSIVCSHCFKKYSLRMIVENTGVASDEPCPRCKSPKGKKISEDDFLWLMTSYFENGSIDLSVGNHQPKYRIQETQEKTFETLALDSDLIQDCRMLHELTGHSVDLNYSRLADMGIWGFNADLKDITTQNPCDESFDRLDKLLSTAISKFKTITISPGTIIYRIKKNLTHDIDAETATVFDPQTPSATPEVFPSRDRFSASIIPVFYGAFDISTCLFECRTEHMDELTLGTFEVSRDLKLLDLEELEETTTTGYEREDLGYFVSRMLYQREYALNNYFSVMAFRLGFQGLKYCSYFSKVRGERLMNVAIFGSPIAEGKLLPTCFDQLTIDNVEVKYSLGPVFQKERETQMIREIISRSQEPTNSIPKDAIDGKSTQRDHSDFKIDNHSLAAIRKIYRRER
jgi:hypothetical protein